MRSIACLLLVLLGPTPALAQQTASQWVWYPEKPASECLRENRWFRKTFDLPEKPQAAALWLLVDDSQRLWVNGQGPLQPLAGGEPLVLRFDVAALLQRGRNVLALIGWNGSGPAGVQPWGKAWPPSRNCTAPARLSTPSCCRNSRRRTCRDTRS
jgi:hypothetical protein